MHYNRGKEKIDPVALPRCPFLAYRPASEGHQKGAFEQIICEAGGGFVLGTTESINVAQKICISCDIRQSLTFRYACLYVVPFRVFQDSQVQTYYGCRWYFRLNPRNTPKNMDWCMGCRDWFPRPHESLILDRITMSHKFLKIFLNPSEDGNRPFTPLSEEDKRWYVRLRDLFYRWFSIR